MVRCVRVALLAACAALILAGEGTVGAMVTVPAEFGVMVTESQIVVHGRVVDVRSFETAGRATIETRVAVQVLESFKGQPEAVVYFRVPGGQVGRYRRVMVGAPTFVPGDEVVVFLKGDVPRLPLPFGLTQGVFRVTRSLDGRAQVSPVVAGVAGPLVRGDGSRRPLDVASFGALVRTAAGDRP